jgi:hypothetical protein
MEWRKAGVSANSGARQGHLLSTVLQNIVSEFVSQSHKARKGNIGHPSRKGQGQIISH